MIINHPHLGPRDAAEFTVLGDASLLDRPDWQAGDADNAVYEYLYLRANPAGLHRELWFHEQGDRSWLVVTRNTVTHAVVDVAFARDVVVSSKTSNASKASTVPKASKTAREANAESADKRAQAKKIANRGITGDKPR